MSASSIEGATVSDETFCVVDTHLAGEDSKELAIQLGARKEFVQDFYEGKRTCDCCINWVEECPPDLDLEYLVEGDTEKAPLTVRHQRTFGGSRALEMHSIEVNSAKLRHVLEQVFAGFDGIIPGLKYLTFMAPFKNFYYRWDRFEKAIEDEQDEAVAKGLKWLRSLVKRQLADEFAISKDMLEKGVITYTYLWTLFKPGDLIYSKNKGDDQFYILQSTNFNAALTATVLNCLYVDWDGYQFGFNYNNIEIGSFMGTKSITELPAFPVSYLPKADLVREKLLLRGQKFRDLSKVQYKAYHEPTIGADPKNNKSNVGLPSPSRTAHAPVPDLQILFQLC
jgi:hypothetical protein